MKSCGSRTDCQKKGTSHMKRLFLTLVVSLVAALALATPALAATIIKFNSSSSYDKGYDGSNAGVYLGTVNGQNTQFICDDFINEIQAGQSWYAYNNTNSPNVSTGPTGVRYAPTGYGQYNISNPDLAPAVNAGLTQQQEYNMIAWLVGKIFSDPTNQNLNWASEAGAIWSIADGGWSGTCSGVGPYNCSYLSTNNDTSGLTTKTYVQDALAYKDTSFPKYNVYTPYAGPNCGQGNNPSCNGQEFWAETPEAATPLLLGLATIFGGLVRKKARLV